MHSDLIAGEIIAKRTINVDVLTHEDGRFSALVCLDGEQSGWGISCGDLDGTVEFAVERIKILLTEQPESAAS